MQTWQIDELFQVTRSCANTVTERTAKIIRG